MPCSITARYHFESAHFLPGVPTTHKCSRMHGHNYKLDIEVMADDSNTLPDPHGTGFVMDFAELGEFVKPLIRQIDHRILNEVSGLENPTAELIAVWFLRMLVSNFVQVRRVTVWETDAYSATVWYEDEPILSANVKKAITHAE